MFQWSETRIMRKRLALGADERGQRRVFELFDGRHLVDVEGTSARIVDGSFEEALAIAALLEQSALAAPVATVPWWRRLLRWLGGRP